MKQFRFWNSYYDPAIMALSEEDQNKFFVQITRYAFTGEEYYELDGVALALWMAVKPSLDKSRGSSGRGGRPQNGDSENPNTETDGFQNTENPSGKTEVGKPKNQKPIYSDSDSDSVIDNTVEDIVNHLNQETNSKFRANTDSTVKAIHGRLNDGYTPDDIKSVITFMRRKWKGSEMEKYLTPDTLFRPSKFEKYFNEWDKTRPKPQEKPPDDERIEPYDPDAFERNDELYAAGYRIDDGYWVKVRGVS